MLERSKALQIYFKPGLKEDDVMLRVWQAAKRSGRPQEIFRDMLREGLVALVANGTMPESIIEECGLDAIVERRRRRTAKHADRPAPPQPAAAPMPPYGYPAYQQYPVPPAYPPQDFPAYGPNGARHETAAEQPAPIRAPEPPAPQERTAPQPRPDPARPEPPGQPGQASPQPPAALGEDGKPVRKLGKLM